MSFFGSIIDRIVHFAGGAAAPAAAAEPAPAAAEPAAPDAVPAASEAAPVPTTAAPLQSVDVGAVLAARDAQHGGGLNWQSSIVDLLKLLDLDSSLQARKTLATELDVHAGEDGTAEQNLALHHAVVEKLAANGGKVPAEMRG